MKWKILEYKQTPSLLKSDIKIESELSTDIYYGGGVLAKAYEKNLGLAISLLKGLKIDIYYFKCTQDFSKPKEPHVKYTTKIIFG